MAELLTRVEVAEDLGIPVVKIDRLTTSGRLRGVQVSKHEVRYLREDVRSFVKSLAKDGDLTKGEPPLASKGKAEAKRRFGEPKDAA